MVLMSIPIVLSLVSSNSGDNSKNSDSHTIKINLSEMKKIGTVDERYQSYNVEILEVVGGEFWKSYKLMDGLPSAEDLNYDVSQKNEKLYHKLSPVNLPQIKDY